MHKLIKIPILLILTAGGAIAGDKPPVPAEAEEPPVMQEGMMILPFPGRVIGNIDQSHFPEPSGIVFHPLGETLFVVGDEGDLGEMKTDGTLLRKKHYPAETFRMDFEGITVDPLTGLLYVAVEGAETFLEIDPEDLAIKRQFPIKRTMNGKTVMATGGQGIKGIAFRPDPGHPQGGTFFVANQAFDLNHPEDASAIFEVEVPLKDTSGDPPAGKLLEMFPMGITDLSDLYYDVEGKALYAISDTNNLLFLLRPYGWIYVKYTDFPGSDQEGITEDGAGNVYITQDSGGILKIEWTNQLKND